MGPEPAPLHHHHYDLGPAVGVGLRGGQADTEQRVIQLEQDILGVNNAIAAANRRWLRRNGILSLNLVSSPGAGKTSLLTETIRRLPDASAVTVIEGDQQTDLDAARIRETGAKALQINTGKGCHLDARMVNEAIGRLNMEPASLLLIENVGNLVCPASFDLGEEARVVILSVTEGDDKPLKYPDIFVGASLMIVSKTDLLPYVHFDIDRVTEYARRINPDIACLTLSVETGQGMDAWMEWLEKRRSTFCITAADGDPGLVPFFT
ncbi:hydrogenase nickel incorporation protein HypB [Phaeovibrio sulfidiphilus]|uniref:hydrogenase nickel incorporation protein HypB n=1 Tax=Phaeovibrio sulfidiphilus TaxID=1220600 RepID=UPI0030843011